MPQYAIMMNRAPVLTLWASIVAERLGFDHLAALSLGKGMAGLTAQKKGQRLGIFKPAEAPGGGPPKRAGLGEDFWVELCGRPVPAKHTTEGIRAVVKDRPIDPAKVEVYFQGKFGPNLAAVRQAMQELAAAFEPEALAERAYSLYEAFRPQIPSGKRGWGAQGVLDLDVIHSLAASG